MSSKSEKAAQAQRLQDALDKHDAQKSAKVLKVLLDAAERDGVSLDPADKAQAQGIVNDAGL